jgi:cold shock CspA family protein
MKLIYGEDKYFIGAVKFFDTNKDFGFIASNNCNMPSPKYNQDFYVCSASFIEDEAKKEGQIVVFQVAKQDDGKKRAVNVRCITKSDEDAQLALSYYGDHEYIEYKDNRKINLYTYTFKPLGMVADKVRRIIEEDAERSPEKTSEHFKFFVGHYKQKQHSKDRYIFDRQFYTDDKIIWDSLLSIFTNEEKLEVLRFFSSIVKYFSDTNLIRQWLENKLSNNCSLSNLQEIVETYDFIPPEYVDFSKLKIEQIVDSPIKELLKELSLRSDISKEDLDDNLDNNLDNDFWTENSDSEKNKLLDNLQAYLRLTSKQYKKEKTNCLTSVKKNRFKEELRAFVEKQYGAYGRNNFFTYLNNLATEDFLSFKEELVLSISSIIDKAIEENKYWQVVDDIRQLTVMGEEFLNPYRQKLLPLIKDKLKELLRTNLNTPYRIESDFFSAYEHYSSIYEKAEKVKIKQELILILRGTQSIGVLSEVSTGLHTWLSIDEALALSKQIISQWDYAKLKEFVKHESCLFNHSIEFADIVIAKAREVIEDIPLSHFFDGTPLKDGENMHYPRYPERENCLFLNNLKKLIPDDNDSSEWDNYIKSRSTDDLLILFEHDVITSLPENTIEIIINAISLNGVYADKERWYIQPSLKNKTYAKVLESTKVNLFPLIARRLQSLEMTDENVALAVLLTELMTANMPGGDSDYHTRRNWETSFTSQIQNFKKTNNINQRLAVIWWAVHSKTTTSAASLTEVFAFLPPYLQIKIVKKLFKSMSEGKIHHTAESFYNLISNGERPICFPLEIAFTYLKLREKDQKKTLDNNVMLQLLKGREDTGEWIGIRSIVTQCSGRWEVSRLPDDRRNWKRNNYFNGVISKIEDGRLKVFIPQKMIDEYGNIQDYRNKHYARAIQQIQITYKKNEYEIVNEPNGVSYYFDEAYEVELFAIARPFNFKYNGLNNFVEFKTKEEDQEEFCECRLSDKVDKYHGIAFYWCGNKPCFRPPVTFRTDDEWEYYTILDFMRILGINPDYINRNGYRTKFGHYIILSSYLKSFAKFYEHLKCRECGKLMKPSGITNFTSRAVTEFSCTNDNCKKKGFIVYLNHCFNKQKCNATIDSRDSKQCPNGQYICPECGACCSTENFRLRISHLHMTGGVVSDRLRTFVEHDLGHWEKHEYFCYKCGNAMQMRSDDHYVCPNCDTEYDHSK